MKTDIYQKVTDKIIDPVLRIDHADEFFANMGADVCHGGNRAFYSGGSDHVQMPFFETFRCPEAYYATLAHDLTHWTKHKCRLDREFGRKKWGDQGYARDELVAELGAAFLCADLALFPESGADHAAYVQSLAQGSKKRQARDLQRSGPSTARGGLLEQISR